MKTVLILHGWASQVQRWQPLILGLESLGFKVLLPDLPGFKKPLTRPYAIKDYSLWLKDYLKKQKITKVNLIGHSFGGQIAIHFTTHHPESVNRLVLIASAGIRNQFSLKRWLFLPIAKIGKLIIKSPFFKKLLYKTAREQDYFKASPMMKETLKIISREDQQQNLRRLKMKTLILWGDKDKYTPLKQAKLTHNLIPQSTLQIFPGAGHNLPFVEVKTIGVLISNFCR